MARRRQDRMVRRRQGRMKRRQTAQCGREKEREGEGERKKVQSIHKQVVVCPSKRPRTLWLYTSSSRRPADACHTLYSPPLPSISVLRRFLLHPTFLPISRGSMPRFGFAVSHGGAGARRRRALLSLGRRGAIPSASHDEGAVLSSSAARCKCMMPPSSHDEGAVPSSGAALSLGRRGAIPPASHDEGTVLSHGWGASVSW